MSQEVIFDDENPAENTVGNIQIVPGPPKGMLAWLVKEKIVQNAKQAEILLLVVTAGAALLAIIIFVFFTGQPAHQITPEQKAQLVQMLAQMQAQQHP